jgi:hypothetical protein
MCPFEGTALYDSAMGPEAQNTRVTREGGGAEKQPCDTVKFPTIHDHIVEEIEDKCGRVYGVKITGAEGK